MIGEILAYLLYLLISLAFAKGGPSSRSRLSFPRELLLAEARNTAAFENYPELHKRVLDLFSLPSTAGDVSEKLVSILRCLPQVAAPKQIGYGATFRVVISQFLDRFNFDLGGVKRSCVHFAEPDGGISLGNATSGRVARGSDDRGYRPFKLFSLARKFAAILSSAKSSAMSQRFASVSPSADRKGDASNPNSRRGMEASPGCIEGIFRRFSPMDATGAKFFPPAIKFLALFAAGDAVSLRDEADFSGQPFATARKI
jgi:hypothetical protein